jgi:hypothetical protein
MLLDAISNQLKNERLMAASFADLLTDIDCLANSKNALNVLRIKCLLL